MTKTDIKYEMLNIVQKTLLTKIQPHLDQNIIKKLFKYDNWSEPIFIELVHHRVAHTLEITNYLQKCILMKCSTSTRILES